MGDAWDINLFAPGMLPPQLPVEALPAMAVTPLVPVEASLPADVLDLSYPAPAAYAPPAAYVPVMPEPLHMPLPMAPVAPLPPAAPVVKPAKPAVKHPVKKPAAHQHPAPKQPKPMRPSDLPKGLDVTYGGFGNGKVKNADMKATVPTRSEYLSAKKQGKLIGDLVKSGGWFDANGHLKVTARQMADQLSAPYRDTLHGARPNGADAVVFDEINDRLNVAPKTFERALQLVKQRYPNRPLIVYLSHPERLNPELMKAADKYADRVLVEAYQWESSHGGTIRPQDFDATFAPIARTAPGILKKASPVLAISEKPGPYDFNNLANVDFGHFLNDEVYALRHNQYSKNMRGLGAYATYEATPKTLGIYDRLVNWYSKKNHHEKLAL